MKKRIPIKYLKLNKEDLSKLVLKKRNKDSHKLPSHVYKMFDVAEYVEYGCKCYRFRPKGFFNGSYIMYLYGSGMCHNIDNEQWDFIINLCEKTGMGLFMPMYPLAPENCCREVFDMLGQVYSDFSKRKDVERIVLLGDYSGGGLVLSLTMHIWKEGMRKPDQLIMVSPSLDTEFFDKDLESKLLECSGREKNVFYNEAAKDFINAYWVKDYAVKTEYTSPYYEDYTDLCDDVVIFSGMDDLFNCYARAFYNKAKKQGVNVRFFEFEDEGYDFLVYSKGDKQKEAFKYLVDVIKGTYEASLSDIYPLKLLSKWTQKYPDMIRDEWVAKFIYKNNFNFSNVRKISEYENLRLASTYTACDSMVRRYMDEFPNCTIVNVGCRLDNMFERLDNGRVQWYSVDTHNIMSVRRSMYGERPREKTIGRSLADLSWIDDIKCKRNKGIMFVCNDAMTYMNIGRIKMMIDRIWERFPGTELVFTAATTGATVYSNMRRKYNVTSRGRKRTAVDDAQKIFGSWRTDYKIMTEEPVMKYLTERKELKMRTKIALWYNLISYNHKIIHVKLGSEAYDTKI